MSPAVFLYAALLLVVIIGLWAAYRILGTPSRLPPADYRTVLEDICRSAGRAADRLRRALEDEGSEAKLEDVATDTRKIFQTGYFQTLRLRPTRSPDTAAPIRLTLGQACDAYDWASRMIGSESITNPVIRETALRLLHAGDEYRRRALEALARLPSPADPGSTPLSPQDLP